MQAQEQSIAGKTVIDAVMQPSVTGLEEVVVTGYGIATDRRKVAISVETVKSGKLSALPSASIDQALQGKVAGAQIQSITGLPGQQQNIILRGINTLGTNQPMIMIDGVEINTDNSYNGSNHTYSSRLADLDLSNVERIEVVQGAAAATIYGAQGANGVIQIFTKKGTVGETNITVNSSMSTNEIVKGNFKFPSTHYYDTDAAGYVIDSNGDRIVENAGGINEGYAKPQGDPNDTLTLANKPFIEKTYNPLDEIFRKSATYNNAITITGANNLFNYGLFVSDLKQQSVMKGTFERINAKLNLGAEIFKNFKINVSSTYINTTNTTGTITGEDNTASPFGSALFVRPYMNMDIRDNNGFLFGKLERNDNSTNALFGLKNEYFNANVNRIIENFDLNYKPFEFLELNYKYGIDDYSYKFQDLILNQEAYLVHGLEPLQGRIRTLTDMGRTQNSIISSFLTFKASDLVFKTHIAFDYRKRNYDEIESTKSNIPDEPNINMSSGAVSYVTEENEDFVTFGYLVNQHLDYKDMAGISGGFRTDYSSAFGEASKPFTFPRGDAYFRLSETDFWSNVKEIVPELKLRVAYGQAGVQPDPYARIKTMLRNTVGDQSFLLSKLNQTNEALKVQVSKELEYGLDINFKLTNSAFFNNLKFSPTIWNRKSEDVIYDIEVPLSTGAVTILDNAFTLSSKGFQASFDLDIYNSENFNWSFTTTYGKSVTKIDEISNHKDIVLGRTGSGGFVLREGEKLGVFFGYKPLSSVSQTLSDGTRYIDAADEGNYEIVNGYVVEKASKQVVYTTEKEVIGDPNPDFNMSFINSFQLLKAFEISCQIDWFHGLDIYNQTKQWLYRDANHVDFTKSVTVNGQTGPYTAYWQSLYNACDASSPFVEDGSFVRLREVTVAVDLAKLFTIKYIKSLALNFTGHNLLTFTDYSGFDPEAAANLNDPTLRGLDNYSYPNFKTYTVGLKIGF
jgi:TonB-dependent starch-binding outer membrane protein SusC